MTNFLYIVDGVALLFSLGLLAGFMGSKSIGLLLAGITMLAAAITSFILLSWWPLLAGFAMLWIFRLLGFDPSPH